MHAVGMVRIEFFYHYVDLGTRYAYSRQGNCMYKNIEMIVCTFCEKFEGAYDVKVHLSWIGSLIGDSEC